MPQDKEQQNYMDCSGAVGVLLVVEELIMKNLKLKNKLIIIIIIIAVVVV